MIVFFDYYCDVRKGVNGVYGVEREGLNFIWLLYGIVVCSTVPDIKARFLIRYCTQYYYDKQPLITR